MGNHKFERGVAKARGSSDFRSKPATAIAAPKWCASGTRSSRNTGSDYRPPRSKPDAKGDFLSPCKPNDNLGSSSGAGNFCGTNEVLEDTRKRISKEIKKKFWMPLEGRHKAGAWEALDGCYSEGHRAYHTWEHIAHLLKKLDEFSYLARRIDIVAISIFWHDVVHRAVNQDGIPCTDYENVRDSCKLFREFTLLNTIDADAVHDLIMGTADHLQARAEKQHYVGFAGDLDLFLDLDLSSLASPWNEFARGLDQIRSELSWVPETDFCSSRLRLLQAFAKQDVRLYRRAEARQEWFPLARANLKRGIAKLQARLAELSAAECLRRPEDSLPG